MLLDCLEAYAGLDEAQAQELDALLQTERYRGARAMPITSFEKGLQQGQQQGQQQCQRTMLEKQLEARFGPLGPEVRQRVENLSAERLEELALALLTARSLQELGLGD